MARRPRHRLQHRPQVRRCGQGESVEWLKTKMPSPYQLHPPNPLYTPLSRFVYQIRWQSWFERQGHHTRQTSEPRSLFSLFVTGSRVSWCQAMTLHRFRSFASDQGHTGVHHALLSLLCCPALALGQLSREDKSMAYPCTWPKRLQAQLSAASCKLLIRNELEHHYSAGS